MNSLSFILVYLTQQIYASSEAHYECGAHGKFEYCIDAEPGCVVGCHCHPGYYFDTDTKVCEPNIKLTQFRRQFNHPVYELGPTRVPTMNFETPTASTFTSLNPIDAKVEEISKDTDDLGDWLYNQFFKTIENQVINNTDNEVKTRRSDAGGRPNKRPKKRSHNKHKKSKSKKKKKKGLKSKLLRITEDDSLFDSSSSSSSDDSESTSSESESDSSSDHDHRKILMINKKPTPPLPSFIFLPNVETPYYPPIGLPAPPVMPMYPMVPVPPMGVMIVTTTTTTSTESPSTETTTAEPEITTEKKEEKEKSTTTEAIPETTAAEPEDAPAARHGGSPGRPNKTGHRNKFLQKIRDKMKKRNKLPPVQDLMEDFKDQGGPFIEPIDQSMERRLRSSKGMPKLGEVDFKYLSQLIHKIDLNQSAPDIPPFNPLSNYPNAYDMSPIIQRRNYPSTPYYENNMPNWENGMPNHGNNVPNYGLSMPNYGRSISNFGNSMPNCESGVPNQGNGKPNYGNSMPNCENGVPNHGNGKPNYGNSMPNYGNSMPNYGNNKHHTYAQASSLKLSHKPRPASKADEVNESYFSGLGKEIASLIRSIDSTGEHMIDIELQHQTALQPGGLFNGNRFSQGRSYWERFVRSPLQNLFPFYTKNDHRKHSSENLVDIENEVNVATAVERTFSLQELENMANVIELAQIAATKGQSGSTERSTIMRSSTISEYDYKFNLLPQLIGRNKAPLNVVVTSDTANTMNEEQGGDVRHHQFHKFLKHPLPRNSLLNYKNETLYNKTRHLGDMSIMNNLKNLFRPHNYQTPLHQQVSRLVQRNISNALTAQQLTKYQINPILLNYKSVNYVSNNHNLNKYHVQPSIMPFQMPVRSSLAGKQAKPSYFHHELHHFDYFDK